MKTEMFIDLHLHLDGSLSLRSARRLAAIGKIDLPEDDEDLKRLLSCPSDCRDLNDYLRCFDLPCRLMQTSKSVKLAAYDLCRELKQKGYIYAEIRFAPQKHTDCGMTQEDVVRAAISGIKTSHFNARLILCCMRGSDNEKENLETVRIAKKYLGKTVCAVDLAGAEAVYPNCGFKNIFDMAKKEGVLFTVHSGEALGPESVRTAVEFGAKRIGHGVRSAEDSGTVRLLTEKKITLEICPTSNLNTGIFGNISEMPFRMLDESGVLYTLNSDNMAVSDTDVKHETDAVKQTFGFGREFEKRMLLNAANAAFCDEKIRNKLIKKIESAYREKK